MGSEKPEANEGTGAAAGQPVLGLSDAGGEPVDTSVRWAAAPGTVFDQPEPEH